MHDADKNIPAVFIMGPTASGKTDLAIKLVKRFPFEIISVDSALVYRGMDIGTAKPSEAELKLAPHRLIDICDPAETYSTAQFREDAIRAVNEIHAENKIPLLVGGTMLYHRSLLYGLSELPCADEKIRKELERMILEKGSAYLHDRLREIDLVAAEKIHPNDPQRIQRALEVYEITGKTMTQLQAENQAEKLPWNCYRVVIAPKSRELLRERIAIRFRQMIEYGFIEEVESLHRRKDLDLSMPSMRAVGYRQVWEYLEGKMNRQEMMEKGIAVTRQFAKRQMTWLRKENDAFWIETEDDQGEQKVIDFLAPILTYAL